jgi:pyruvate kinase
MSENCATQLLYRRTKIVATIGPVSSDIDTIVALISAGVNVFRLNMSHGTQAEHRERYERIRAASGRMNRPVAVLADLCGPKIRVGLFENGQVRLVDGTDVTVTVETVLGTAARFSSQYLELAQDVVPGSLILLDDGNIELNVVRVEGTEIYCKVMHGGILKDKKGMNLPNVNVSAEALTKKDRDDARFASSLGVDFVALSFVRTGTDIDRLRELLTENKSNALIVAKIEKPEALTNIVDIIDRSDAIMVARGDLGVELDFTQVPNVQEQLVDLARVKQKPVIVATQMLESMITQSRPTRAEVTDVANAVRSGADAVMLSAETAAGAHPVDAVRTMDNIIRRTEQYQFEHGAFSSIEFYTPTDTLARTPSCLSAEEAIATTVASLTRQTTVNAIVAASSHPKSVSYLSSQRPATVIVVPGVTSSTRALSALSWGVVPIVLSDAAPADPAALVRALEGLVSLEHSGGFWLVVGSTGEKTASMTLVPS